MPEGLHSACFAIAARLFQAKICLRIVSKSGFSASRLLGFLHYCIVSHALLTSSNANRKLPTLVLFDGRIQNVKENLPTLNELGNDLLKVSRLQVFLSLAFPFMLTAGFFIFCGSKWWLMAFLCPVLISFFTYGSVSHDLVHRTLGLPRLLNETLLCAIEMLTLRSGHAYRSSHLNHHAKFPAEDDLEGAAASMSIPRSLLDGITLQYRIWYHAAKSSKVDKIWIYGEAIAIVLLFIASVAVIPYTMLPFIYVALVIGGSWIFPMVTSYIPHNSSGTTELTKTRLYRGMFIRLVSMDHLYHLEHHLYPQVPHHSWPKLARRLDPHFERLGVHSLKLWF